MKTLILFMALFILLSLSIRDGFCESSRRDRFVTYAQNDKVKQQPLSGRIVIKGKGGKVTGVEQKPNGKKKKQDNKKGK
ncbi:MAG: hypothetical protein JEY79_17180 [Pseudodesulfovibrio sp.]|nr:hypothetical protein [Pseudodesulfovibrio sp.]